MRILIVTATYSPSINGVAISVATQKSELEKRGHEITILAPKHPDQKEEKGVIRLPSLPNPAYTDYPIILPIPTMHNLRILQEKYDLVYFHHPLIVGEISLNLARLFNCPAIFFYHTRYELYGKYYISKFLPRSFIIYLITQSVRKIANNSDSLIVETNSIKEILKKQKITTEIKVITTVTELMQNNRKSVMRKLKKFNFNQKEKIILCVSRFSKEKNLFSLLKMMKIVSKRIKFRLYLAGDGPERTNLENLAAKLHILPLIKFTGAINQTDLPGIYNQADLFVYPCQTDTQGIVILEALSAGLPVVAFNFPGAKDFISNGVNGFLANSNKEFSAYVLKLMTDNRTRKTISQNSYLTSANYNLDDSINKLEELFKNTRLKYIAEN